MWGSSLLKKDAQRLFQTKKKRLLCPAHRSFCRHFCVYDKYSNRLGSDTRTPRQFLNRLQSHSWRRKKCKCRIPEWLLYSTQASQQTIQTKWAHNRLAFNIWNRQLQLAHTMALWIVNVECKNLMLLYSTPRSIMDVYSLIGTMCWLCVCNWINLLK